MSKVLGITGGIGSGKSFIGSILEYYGIPIYYTDTRAKSLYNEDQALRLAMIKLFGEQLYETKTGEIDRAYLANRIFSDSSLLIQVNQLVHPAVRLDFDTWCEQQKTCGMNLIGIESAILFQSKELHSRVDYSILVEAPLELRLERAIKRDKQEKVAILKRIQAQISQEEMHRHATFHILNDGKTLLLPQIDHILEIVNTNPNH